MAESITELHPQISSKLLDAISMVLQKKPFADTTDKSLENDKGGRAITKGLKRTDSVGRSSDTLALALQTLGEFNFIGQPLLNFVCECVVTFLEDPNPGIRKEAAASCSKLLLRPDSNDMSSPSFAPRRGLNSTVVAEVLEKLLVVGISDPEPSIRLTVLKALDSRYDYYLAQAQCIRSLFIAVNDENFEIREVVIQIIGRLTQRNPAYVMPTMRKMLIQLLTELEFGTESRQKEEAARLLRHLIHASQRLIKPYVQSILKVLHPRLRDSNSTVASCVLATLGELALVGAHEIRNYLDIFSVVIEALQDQGSVGKREVAVRTLVQLVQATGSSIEPYSKYPQLMGIIISGLQSEQSIPIRIELIRLLGTLGALDPMEYKHIQMRAKHRQADVVKNQIFVDEDEVAIVPSNEDYYPSVAISALIRILRDSTLATHHPSVSQAIMKIFQAMGIRCVQFLPKVMPPFLSLINSAEFGLRDNLFMQLGHLVSVVKQHIRPYLDDIFSLIDGLWTVPTLHIQILSLVEEISSALKDEFKSCVPDLLPHMLNILNNRIERDTGSRGPSSANMNAVKVLQVLRKFDSNLDDYLHLVVPSVVRLAELADNSPDLQKDAVKWLGDMCPCLNFSDFASRIIHPLTRILDTGTPEIKREVIITLTAVATELGSDFLVFRNLISSCVSRNNLSTANVASQDVVSKYESVVMRISRGMPVAESAASSGSLAFIPPIEEPHAPETVKKIQINPHNLRKAWESSQRSTRDDWTEWIRRFSVELLRESSSPALRSCAALAQVYTPLARELFNAAFVSCWSELGDTFQQALVSSVGLAFDTEKAPNVPPEVLQILLNLAEFMEHDEHPLPIDVRRLGEVAEKCQAFAKALHYKEHEFKSAPQATIGSLISINYQLNQPEAADGILVYAKNQQATEGIQEEWYEKLRQWDEALNAYESRLEKVATVAEKDKVYAGIVRCLYNVGDWQSLHDKAVNLGDRAVSREVAWMATMSAWHLNQWESMRHFSEMVDEKSIEGSYFRAVLAVHHNDFSLAESWIEQSRTILDTKLTALVGESYERAYDSVVRAMEICELEEVLTLKRLSPDLRQSHLDRLKLCWNARLYGCQASVDVWHRVLAARSVVIAPHTDLESWAKFCSLCIKSSKRLLASNTIISLMRASSGAAGKAFSPSSLSPSPMLEVLDALSGHADPRISYVSMKFLWNFDQKNEALVSMRRFVENRSDGSSHLAGRLQARCHLRIGEWTRSSTDALNESSIAAILNSYKSATEFDASWGKAWHSWALMNYDVIQWLLDNKDNPGSSVIKHAIPAIKGFFKSISLAQDAALQDILRLLTLWFKHGAQPEVEQVLIEGFNIVDITTWLEVIPQIIARINTPAAPIRKLINDVLCRVGYEHPQALIYPLTVAAKSQSVKRKAAADAVMGHMLQFSPNIVNQAVLVSQELIRVAILWHEIWHEALEEASRLFFSEKNIDGMFQVLEPVHAMMDKGAETVRETSFMQLFGRDLTDANECCLRYKAKKAKGLKEERDLSQAWDLYYHVYKNITKQLPQMTTLELQYVSPKLLEAHELDLCVPGTYKAGRDIVSISSFSPTLTVMVSKQRPRRCTIHGSDGTDYQFLLKGHEDLRQDERVMQLFGLVNTLLLNDRDCCRQELNIQRYSVIPLSPKSGLIEWVPNCDTLHALIKDYRDSKKALVTIEHRIILQMAPDFEHLPLIKKIEVFRHTLEQTTGLDLYKVLWLKSRNSEVWLQRRTNFTRSLAVMSMVGYILGLGDRHPSNLMLHKYTGKVRLILVLSSNFDLFLSLCFRHFLVQVLHIDFGDCFEVATKRDKFPEKIPFRLTRMLIKVQQLGGPGACPSLCLTLSPGHGSQWNRRKLQIHMQECHACSPGAQAERHGHARSVRLRPSH
jgi:FKBP12-rapamycin complex-associated protein